MKGIVLAGGGTRQQSITVDASRQLLAERAPASPWPRPCGYIQSLPPFLGRKARPPANGSAA